VAAVGVKVAAMLQVAAGARVAPQVLVEAKLEAFVPPRVMDARVSVAVPELVSVTLWEELVVLIAVAGKVMVEAENVAAGEVVWEPVSWRVCVELAMPAELSVATMLPV
jgi:hypothetical protein